MIGACLCPGAAAGVWVLLTMLSWYLIADIKSKWKGIIDMNLYLGTLLLSIVIVICNWNKNAAHRR